MKKIACLTDFSEKGNNAVWFANKIARESYSKLLLFHAYMMEEDGREFHPSLTEYSDTESREMLYKMCLDLRLTDQYSDASYEFMVKEGAPLDRLNEVIKKSEIELVVLSAEGGLEKSDTYYGVVLNDVVQNAKCSVLVIPAGCEYSGFKNIVYAFDIENESTLEKDAVRFAKSLNANLNVVSFVHTEDENETEKFYAKFSKLKNDCGYNKIRFDIRVSNSIEKELSEFIVDRNADVLILENHKRGLYKQLTEPSFTKSFVFKSQKPVLVIRSKEF